MNNLPIFYEDIWDAISKMVHANAQGLTVKQIGGALWPGRTPDTARNVFSRAINPENTDANLDPEELVKTMHITNAGEHVIYFLCDEFGFDRPPRKERRTFERNINDRAAAISAQLMLLQKELKEWKKASLNAE